MSQVFRHAAFISFKSNKDLILELDSDLKELTQYYENQENVIQPYWTYNGKSYIKMHLIGNLYDSNKKKINPEFLIPHQSLISGQCIVKLIENPKDGKKYINLNLLIGKCINVEQDLFDTL